MILKMQLMFLLLCLSMISPFVVVGMSQEQSPRRQLNSGGVPQHQSTPFDKFLPFPKRPIKTFKVERIEIKGADYTDENWILEYLEISIPLQVTNDSLDHYRKKLLTTNVFTDVSLAMRGLVLEIDVKEKWTVLPVVRFALGGGTPLKVFGIYDIHSFGRLWNLGVEQRVYGDAPPSWVTWSQAPRWRSGKHLLGLELWKLNRIRDLHDREDKPSGRFELFTDRVRAQMLLPWSKSGASNLQLGVDLRLRHDHRVAMNLEDGKNATIPKDNLAQEKNLSGGRVFKLLPQLIFDNIIINGLNFDGMRVIVKPGTIFENQGQAWYFVTEGYQFLFLPYNINLAFHHFLGDTNAEGLNDHFFLGGFDSIRGLPDSIQKGRKAFYLNSEFRVISMRTKNLAFQNVFFWDQGAASENWRSVQERWRSAVGLGLRIAVPKIYRFIVRMDYAWSTDRPGTHGISLGMNHFFQPYRPLDSP